MDNIVMLVALSVMVGAWLWLARVMLPMHWAIRHLAGGITGGFAGFMVVVIAITGGIIAPKSPQATTPSSEAQAGPASAALSPASAPIQYTITQDEHRIGRPRKVEVTLNRRLTDAELAKVASDIRDDSDVEADKTFIGLRVEGQTETAYWANASFDPDYQHTLIGVSAQDYQKLLALDLSGYPDQGGRWISDGAPGHVMVLYKRDGKYFIDSIFPDGEKNTEAYKARPLADGDLRLEQPNDFGEYYILKRDGLLQGWSENGMYLVLSPNKG